MLEHLRKRLTDRAFSASPEANVPVKCTSERGGSLEMNLGWQVCDSGKTIGPAKVHLHQHTVWAASRRSWKPLFSRKVLMLSPSQKRGGMTIIMGVLQWLDISSLEDTGEAGEVVE